MEKKIYDEKKEDYADLFTALQEMLDRFKDYTPEREQELLDITQKACGNSEDIPGGAYLFKKVAAYIRYRYEEMRTYEERRRANEAKFFAALPEILDKVAVPNENSCKDLANIFDEYQMKDNFQILSDAIIKKLASL